MTNDHGQSIADKPSSAVQLRGYRVLSERENSTLVDRWGDTQLLPEGWILKMPVAGETLNSFLIVGISKLEK